MKILIVSGSFPDEGACELREYGHNVNCARDIKSAQRCINDGFKPDLIYIDNRLESAQFFAKQMRYKYEESEIYVMVRNREATNEDPSRLGIDGFIVGDLEVEKVVERAGDLRESSQSTVDEAVTPDYLSEITTVTTEYIPHKKAKRTGPGAESEDRADKEKTRLLRRQEGRKTSVEVMESEPRGDNNSDDKRYRHVYRLMFPAIVLVFTAAAALNLYFPRGSHEKPVATMADLRGMNLEESTAYLDGQGIPYEVIEARSEDGTDQVVDQEPPPGTALDEVDSVTLIVSVKVENKDPSKDALNTDGNMANKDGGGNVSPPSSPALDSQAGDVPGVPDDPPAMVAPVAPAPAPKPVPAPTPGSRPVVTASASPSSGPSSGVMVTLSASAYDPDGGSIVSYSWSCGGSGPTICHEFTSNIAPTSITVTVTVTDDEGQTASSSVTVSLI